MTFENSRRDTSRPSVDACSEARQVAYRSLEKTESANLVSLWKDKNIRVAVFAVIFCMFVAAHPAASAAGTDPLDCDGLQRKAIALVGAPNLQIAPTGAHFAIPAGYFQGYRMVTGTERLVSSARLVASIYDFSPIPHKEDPAFLGKCWGDTITISIEQTGIAKSGKDLLRYFLGQHLTPLPGPDRLGFDVFQLEHGLDRAEELLLSPDKEQFFLCSANPVAPSNYYETVLNPVPGENLKMTFSVNHMELFQASINKLAGFVACFSKQ